MDEKQSVEFLDDLLLVFSHSIAANYLTMEQMKKLPKQVVESTLPGMIQVISIAKVSYDNFVEKYESTGMKLPKWEEVSKGV